MDPPCTSLDGIEGTWSVVGSRLELSGLGFGELGTYVDDTLEEDRYPAIRFTLTKKLNDPRALNNVMGIARAITNSGPKGILINQYCRVN